MFTFFLLSCWYFCCFRWCCCRFYGFCFFDVFKFLWTIVKTNASIFCRDDGGDGGANVFHCISFVWTLHRMRNIMANSYIYLYKWWMHNEVDMLKCRVAFKNTKSHCSFTHIKHSFHQIYFNCIFSVYQFILIFHASLLHGGCVCVCAFLCVRFGVWILLLLLWIALICGFLVVANCVRVCILFSGFCCCFFGAGECLYGCYFAYYFG